MAETNNKPDRTLVSVIVIPVATGNVCRAEIYCANALVDGIQNIVADCSWSAPASKKEVDEADAILYALLADDAIPTEMVGSLVTNDPKEREALQDSFLRGEDVFKKS